MSASVIAEPLAAPTGHAPVHTSVAFPRDTLFGAATPGKIAMWIFLVSDALSFSGLLIGYGILRGGSTVWRHPGEPALGVNFTAFLTFLLICSSVSMVMAYSAALAGDRKKTALWLALTILGGLGFLAGQMHEYFGFFPGFPTHPLRGLVGEGLIPGHSAYASTFYLTTGFHGCHVLAGVVYLSTVLARVLSGKLDGRPGAVELAGLFWHFVDLVWILVFTLIYLIP